MNGIELLEKYPLAAKVIKDWIMLQMLESFKDTAVPEEFKDFMLNQGVENDKVGTMIDSQPRILFDVFDENNIIIETFLYPDTTFTIKIGNEATTNSWKTRKESEVFAIDVAFEMLENILNERTMNMIDQTKNKEDHYENE